MSKMISPLKRSERLKKPRSMRMIRLNSLLEEVVELDQGDTVCRAIL